MTLDHVTADQQQGQRRSAYERDRWEIINPGAADRQPHQDQPSNCGDDEHVPEASAHLVFAGLVKHVRATIAKVVWRSIILAKVVGKLDRASALSASNRVRIHYGAGIHQGASRIEDKKGIFAQPMQPSTVAVGMCPLTCVYSGDRGHHAGADQNRKYFPHHPNIVVSDFVRKAVHQWH